MKKLYLLAFCALVGCATGPEGGNGGSNGVVRTMNTVNLLTQFLDAYPRISNAVSLNERCKVLPEREASRFEGYVSAINVVLTQTGYIPQETLNAYRNNWIATAADAADLSCNKNSTDKVLQAVELTSRIYQQLGLGG